MAEMETDKQLTFCSYRCFPTTCPRVPLLEGKCLLFLFLTARALGKHRQGGVLGDLVRKTLSEGFLAMCTMQTTLDDTMKSCTEIEEENAGKGGRR